MLKLIRNCLLFVLVVFVTDKAFILVKNTAPEMVQDKRLNDLFEGKINKDLIILGSSRGQADIATWMLEDSLGMSAFNLSFGGSDIEWHLFVLKCLLEKAGPPKVIIKVLDDSFELTNAKVNGFRVDLLYPLVKYSEALEQLIERGEKNRLLSKLLITHQLSKNAYDMRTPPALNDTVLFYGAFPAPAHAQIKEKDKKIDNQIIIYDSSTELPQKKRAFQQFQDVLRENNIKVFYVIPPSYKPLNHKFTERMRAVVIPGSPLFAYDDKDPNYSCDAFFHDPVHMNRTGAEYFTKDLIRFMKKSLTTEE
jgi:hypothetical protein